MKIRNYNALYRPNYGRNTDSHCNWSGAVAELASPEPKLLRIAIVYFWLNERSKCCLFSFLPCSTWGKTGSLEDKWWLNFSLLSFSFPQDRQRWGHPSVLCHESIKRKNSRLRHSTLTSPSRPVSRLKSNGLISKKLTGSEVLQGIQHVAHWAHQRWKQRERERK